MFNNKNVYKVECKNSSSKFNFLKHVLKGYYIIYFDTEKYLNKNNKK